MCVCEGPWSILSFVPPVSSTLLFLNIVLNFFKYKYLCVYVSVCEQVMAHVWRLQDNL